MKDDTSMLFCTSFIDKHNYVRYKKWLDFYKSKLNALNADYLFMIDDGSEDTNFDDRISTLDALNLPLTLKNKLNIVHFKNNLGRPRHDDYKGWWRSFSFSIKLAELYNINKIIHIESDFYVVSKRMLEYLANLSEGWTAFYSKSERFPETGVQVICFDSYKKLRGIYEEALKKNYSFNGIAEKMLPFTKIEREFDGDRVQLNYLLEMSKKSRARTDIDYLGNVDYNYNIKDFKFLFNFDFSE